MLGMALAVPLGLVMAVWLIIGLRRDGEVPIGLEKTFRASMTLFAWVIILVLSSTAFGYYRVWEVQSYVNGIVPRLDEYRAKTGGYPKTLNEIGAPEPPTLLAGVGSYRGDRGYFYFEYWRPFILGSGCIFDNETRQWRTDDF